VSLKILYVPDLQISPGRNLDFVDWISAYCADKKHDVLVQGGDLWDYKSLSSFDRGKASAENQRVGADFKAGCEAVERLESRIKHKPRKVFTEGNHEVRRDRFANDNPAIDIMPDHMAFLRARGWEVYPFLKPVTIGGVAFAHIFPRSSSGKVSPAGMKFGPPNPTAMLKANMRSCVMGHSPGLQTAIYDTGHRTIRGIIAGSAYPWHEKYQGPQGGSYWRGVITMHQVKDGDFALCEVPLSYLKAKYGTRRR
jgi:hypothetical protein